MEDTSIVRISNILNLTRQEFTVVEKHIIHLVLYELKENQGINLTNMDNKEPLTITINGSDVLKGSKNIDVLKDAVKKITTRNLFFDSSKADGDYFGSVTPIPYAKYTAINGHKSEVLIEIHHTCKKMFLELAKGFTSLLVDAILNLKSEYSIRMYELMSMYLNQKSWTISLDKFKTLLNINPTKYKNFNDFERRILIYSQKELWEHCGLHFEWAIAQKERKKITALTFTIRTKEKQEKAQVNADIKATMEYISQFTPKEIAEKSNILMTQYALSAEQKDYILSDTSIFNEFIRIHAIIENMIERDKPPKDRTKYLAKSLGLDKVKFRKN
jgi:plasmid replication initiation protein